MYFGHISSFLYMFESRILIENIYEGTVETLRVQNSIFLRFYAIRNHFRTEIKPMNTKLFQCSISA